MALPKAVQRKAASVREQLAAQNPQQRRAPATDTSDYLSPDQLSAGDAQRRSPDSSSQQQSELPQEVGKRIPHALEGLEGGASTYTQAPSAQDTDNANSEGSDQPQVISENDWKRRYTALRNHRDDRVDTLSDENEKLKRDNVKLQQQLTDLQPAPEKPNFKLDDDTRKALGEDQVKAFEQFNQSVDERFADVEKERNAAIAKAAARFESELASMVPRWQQINKDQKWLDWLRLSDPVTGQIRQTALDRLVDDHDSTGVADLFQQYLSGGNAHVQQRDGHSHLPDVDATTRAGAGLADDPDLVEIWDQSEISDFYQTKTRLYQSGKLVGDTLKRVQAEEARIRKAIDEKRVDYAR